MSEHYVTSLRGIGLDWIDRMPLFTADDPARKLKALKCYYGPKPTRGELARCMKFAAPGTPMDFEMVAYNWNAVTFNYRDGWEFTADDVVEMLPTSKESAVLNLREMIARYSEE